jgi:DNA repair exonuclease SbcCD nuclease subunit
MVAMDRSFRFLHAGDLHLDVPPGSLAEVPEVLRGALADAPYRAAERVFDAAVKFQVDFLVLAGDVVDPALSGPRAIVFLDEQFRRLADHGIRVYWAGGSSDQFEQFVDAWPLPENVLRFPQFRVQRLVHHRGGEPLMHILGTSTDGQTSLDGADFTIDPAGLFSVAVAHGTSDVDALTNRGIHFWALGGSHVRRTLASGPLTIHDCGTTQGRHAGESGPHGCTLVQVDETDRVRTTFIPTDAVRYLDERVTVDETTAYEQLFEILTQRVAELLVDPFGPELVVRFSIVGSRALAERLRPGRWSAELVSRLRGEHGAKRPAAWTVSVEAPSALDVPDELYDEKTLLGEYLRTVRHFLESPDERLNLAPYLAERHLAGHLGALGSLDGPSVRRRVLAEAAALGIELLSPRETGS